jgi:3-dehydroquinate dehydratase I
MICISIGNPEFESCKRILDDSAVRMAEIRLDGAALSYDEIGTIFSTYSNLVATCRPTNGPDPRSDAERKKMLMTAIIAGAAFVDLEVESDDAFKRELIQTARIQQCRVIISYHNYDSTPSRPQLEKIVERCFEDGADIAKVACHVHSACDSARLLALYDYPARAYLGREILAIGMGEKGKITRLAAPLLGAPFTYASMPGQKETAPGQLDNESLIRLYELLKHVPGK